MRAGYALLGIDGGGSTARAGLEIGRRIVARTAYFGLNPVDIGYPLFESRLNELLKPLCVSSAGGLYRVRCCAALAGAGAPAVRRRCREIIGRTLQRFWGGGSRLRLTTDVESIVECYLADRDGIALIAGTGSVCAGVKWRGARRIVERVGGWGGAFDDGSGFKLGMLALKAALDTVDGRRHADRITDSLRLRYGLELDEIGGRFLPPRREEISSLAAVMLECYAGGDAYARRVVREGVAGLVDMVVAVAGRLGLSGDMEIVLAGGLWRNAIMRGLFARRIRHVLAGVRLEHVEDTLFAVLDLARRA